MKVAIVHDWLNQMGGAEYVLEVVHELFPEAPVYTSIYWREAMPPAYREWDIRTSFLDRWPLVKKNHQPFLPFYPLAFEQFDLNGYDLVISIKSAFCHGVITPPATRHLCYCLTTTRFVWNYAGYRAREGFGRVTDWLLRPFLSYLRLWDRLAAERVDAFAAISRAVQARVAKYYRKDSTIIYPPVAVERFTPGPEPPGDYYLVVSRLVPYKRIDLAVRAFNALRLPLVIVGDGRDQGPLRALAGPTVAFRGRVSSEELLRLYRRCRAFIFPGEEDFGIAPVEAMACGRPVVAYAAGGALDTVREGVTGTFFHEADPEALAEAVQRCERMRFDPAVIRAHAEGFQPERFKAEFMRFVEGHL